MAFVGLEKSVSGVSTFGQDAEIDLIHHRCDFPGLLSTRIFNISQFPLTILAAIKLNVAAGGKRPPNRAKLSNVSNLSYLQISADLTRNLTQLNLERP